jgi:hypothetical protein
LKWHGIPSRFNDTFAGFTATVVGVLPILSLVGIPIVARLLRVLQATKRKGLAPLDAVNDILVQLGEPTTDVFMIAAAFLLPFVASLSFIMLGILVEIIVVVYETEPWPVLRAVSFALAVMLPFLNAVFNSTLSHCWQLVSIAAKLLV